MMASLNFKFKYGAKEKNQADISGKVPDQVWDKCSEAHSQVHLILKDLHTILFEIV